MLRLLVFVPGRLLSEHDVTIRTVERPLSSVPQSVRFQCQFGPESVTALFAHHFDAQMHRLQMHLEQNDCVETLLAHIALEATRVFVLQQMLTQVPCGLRFVTAKAAFELGLWGAWRAMDTPRVSEQRPLGLEAATTVVALRRQRHRMHRQPVAVEASARFAGVKTADHGARMRPSGGVRVRMRFQQLARDEGGAALGAQVAPLSGVLRRRVRAQQRARVKEARACAARHGGHRMARYVTFKAWFRCEDALAACHWTSQLRSHAKVRAQQVP